MIICQIGLYEWLVMMQYPTLAYLLSPLSVTTQRTWDLQRQWHLCTEEFRESLRKLI